MFNKDLYIINNHSVVHRSMWFKARSTLLKILTWACGLNVLVRLSCIYYIYVYITRTGSILLTCSRNRGYGPQILGTCLLFPFVAIWHSSDSHNEFWSYTASILLSHCNWEGAPICVCHVTNRPGLHNLWKQI